ncbi:MAG: HEPN domain-containing protein [bacterium]
MNVSRLDEEARRWLRFAREDLTEAEAMLERGEFIPRHACWLAQQAAEKALKAVFVSLEIDFPKKHDLDALRNMIPEGWQVKSDHPDLAELTEWAVEARYPGDWPDATTSDAQTAVEQARAVWESVCSDFARHGLNMDF